MTRALQKLIHVGCRELGLDAETRHDLQLVVTGKESLSEMTEDELNAVVMALRERGFQPTRGAGRGHGARPRAPRADVRFCHVMWRLLAEKGAVRRPGPDGLNTFIRARFAKKWGHVPIDIDAMREWSEISDIVDALKDWCLREGIEIGQ